MGTSQHVRAAKFFSRPFLHSVLCCRLRLPFRKAEPACFSLHVACCLPVFSALPDTRCGMLFVVGDAGGRRPPFSEGGAEGVFSSTQRWTRGVFYLYHAGMYVLYVSVEGEPEGRKTEESCPYRHCPVLCRKRRTHTPCVQSFRERRFASEAGSDRRKTRPLHGLLPEPASYRQENVWIALSIFMV